MEEIKKKCASCKIEKLLKDFAKDKYSKDGLTYSCKRCRNDKYNQRAKENPEKIKEKNKKQTQNRYNYYNSEIGIISSRRTHLKRTYNITLEDYNELLSKQDGKCAICGCEEIYYRNKVLSVDHCHNTNKIRGLLCNNCNRVLGLFKEDKNILLNAIKYLENNN
jgi:hypothetical protein